MPTPIPYTCTSPAPLCAYPFGPLRTLTTQYTYDAEPDSTNPIDDDVVASAVAMLAEEYKHKPKIAALIQVLVSELQVLQFVFGDLLKRRGLLSGQGAQLDLLGKILQFPRLGFSDSDYRLQLQAKVLADISSGTTPQLYAIARLVLPASATLSMVNYYPASFILNIGGVAIGGNLPTIIVKLIRIAKVAGVAGFIEYSGLAPGNTFAFDTPGQGFDKNAGFAVAAS